MAVDAYGMQVWLGITQGTVADCTQAQSLTVGLLAQYPVADGGYDAKEMVAYAIAPGMERMIPLRSRRKDPRDYDQDLYGLCHLEENAFLNPKQGEAKETRYTKNAASFLAIRQIRVPILWTKLF